MIAKDKSKAKAKKRNALEVAAKKGEDRELLMARMALSPTVRHASTASSFAAPLFSGDHAPSIQHDVKALKETIAKVEDGDKAFASQLLASQAVSLDAMFTELARRSAINMGEYMDASERYMRLALKAQSNCRATLDALSKLHQLREQTVKHVQVNEGGQAVVADQFHQHGGQNEKSDKQSHAPSRANDHACPEPSQCGQKPGDIEPLSQPDGQSGPKIKSDATLLAKS